jgi:uncharacterized membrane protein
MARFVAFAVFLLLCACGVYHALHYYPDLPAQVPSNFKMSGQPRGWTPKSNFLLLYLVVVGGTALFFPGLGLLMGKMRP